MGRPKATLLLEGRTLLDHVIDAALRSRLDEVVVVLRPEDDAAREAVTRRRDGRVRVALAPDADRGLGRSLAHGIAALPGDVDAAVVLLADQPRLEPGLIDRVIDAAAHTRRPAVRPVHPDGGRRVPGHPVLLTRALFEAATRLEGDAGARALWRDDPDRLLEEILVETPATRDVDTPEDYERLVAETERRER